MDVFSIMFYEGLKFKIAGVYGAKQHYRCVVLHCPARIHTNFNERQVILFASEHNHTSATIINNPGRKDKKQESANEKYESEDSNGSNNTDEACERSRIPVRVQKYAPTLRILSRATSKVKRMTMQLADNQFMNCLCECGENVLKSNVPLTSRHLRVLQPYKNHLRELVSKKVSITRKKIILHKGGFIGALLKPLTEFCLHRRDEENSHVIG